MSISQLYGIMIFVFVLFSSKTIWLYVKMFIEFIINKKSKWYNKQIERPRLLLYVIALLTILLSFIPVGAMEINIISFSRTSHILFLLSTLILFFISLLIILFSRTKRFETKFITKIKGSIAKRQLKVSNRIDKEEIKKKYQNNNFIHESSFEDFNFFIQNKAVKNKIIWQDRNTRSKQVTYITLFDLLHDIIEGGLISGEIKQSVFTSFIIKNFTIEGVEFDKNIKGRYSEWKYSRNKDGM